VLKDAGLLTERREGTRRLYRARPEGLADVRAFLDGF
jgi:DNA-binding transcriptional ArsR family regulator